MKLKLPSSFFAVFVVFAIVLTLIEATAAGARLRWLPVAFVDLQTKYAPMGVSLRTTRNTLIICNQNLAPPQWHIGSDLKNDRLLADCGSLAGSILKWMPTHGLAYLVEAQVAAHQGDLGKSGKLLRQSQILSPYEGWLSSRRVSIIFNDATLARLVPPDVLAADISTMLATQSGSEKLASFYLKRPETRKGLLQTSAAAEPKHQTRFLNQLRRQRAEN